MLMTSRRHISRSSKEHQMTTFLNILVMLFFGAVFFGFMTGIWWVIQRINAWTRPPPPPK
jgi:fatty-acid desaturase